MAGRGGGGGRGGGVGSEIYLSGTASAHGAVGCRIDPSFELPVFFVPTSTPRLL